MGKKRKHSESEFADALKEEESAAAQRPERSILGMREKFEEKESDSVVFRNKEKVLVTCSRRINYRKQKDLYLWMAKCPNGPSVKFLVNSIHTMEELKLTGNHLNGSRPILTFSTNFDKDIHWKLLKEMITQIFGAPKYHRKSKPYHDHKTSVPHSEVDKVDTGNLDKLTLVEVGPRFCLNPIKIFGGSFGGPTLYENPFYRSPNQIRAVEKRPKAGKYAKKVKATKRRRMHELSNPMEPDEFADMWKEE